MQFPKRNNLHGLGWVQFATAAMAAYSASKSKGGGGGGGGAAGGGMMPAITVSPTLQTQISPQISPVFQQQFQPKDSAITAGTQQYMPTVQSAPQASQPGAMVPAGGSAVPGTADMPYIPTDMSLPTAPGSSGVYSQPQAETPMKKYGVYVALGIGALIVFMFIKKRRTLNRHRSNFANKAGE